MRRRTTPAALALALALSGCDAGNDPCLPGNVRASGSVCAAPSATVAIDGDTADWSDVPAIDVAPACLRPPCDGFVPAALQLARTKDAVGRDALAFRVRLAGGAGPALGGDVRHVFALTETPEYPTGLGDQLVVDASGFLYLRGGAVLETPTGLAAPYLVAPTADGFEGSIAVHFLPFPFGARVAAFAARTNPLNGLLEEVVSSATLARVCWLDARPDTGELCAGWEP